MPSFTALAAHEVSGDLEEGKPDVQGSSGQAGVLQRALAFVVKWSRALLAMAAVYAVLLTMLLMLLRRLPTRGALSEKAHLPENTELLMKLPRNISELRAVRHTLELYRANYATYIAGLLVLVYLVLTSLSIPGALIINLLIGSLYSLPLALVTVAAVSTAGACLNYELSAFLVRDMIIDLMPGKIGAFHHSVERHRDHLLNYFVVIRVTPLLPSWFINFSSPIVNIDRRTFALGTFIGAQPLNIISVSAGRTLSKLTSYRDLYGPRTLLLLTMCACAALTPVFLKRLLSRTRARWQSTG